MNNIIEFLLRNRFVTLLLILLTIAWGLVTAPFDWEGLPLPSDPVAVDAIPNIGENQQIVFTSWPGRSPQDVEDQVTYPLTTSLLGIPGVKSIRSSSNFGMSNIYVVFEEGVEFYWSRTRILEQLNALPENLLPNGVKPQLGPDATALGQVYWYTLEGRDTAGNVTGGWDLHEVRSVQDFYVRYSLSAVKGVSEVASIGGMVQQYQVVVDPDKMKNYEVTLSEVANAIKNSNQDVGANTMEINKVEYLVRGIGYIENVEDINLAVVKATNHVPIRIQDIAKVQIGPQSRRGILDKGGAEVAGGVVVARYGENPQEVIENIKEKVHEIQSGLPSKTLKDGRKSQLTIVPFYDRSALIKETVGTLEEALTLQVLITVFVIILAVFNLRASLLVSSLLPIAILMVFIAMRYLNITANIVALSGIAIAIGTMVDLGIVLSENFLLHLENSSKKLLDALSKAVKEVSGAILTAVSTTIVSFIPVFALEGSEGKLFGPLAATKTIALIAALITALFFLPTISYYLFKWKIQKGRISQLLSIIGLFLSLVSIYQGWIVLGILGIGLSLLLYLRNRYSNYSHWNIISVIMAAIAVLYWLSDYWLPLGPSYSLTANFFFVLIILGSIMGLLFLVQRYYEQILTWCLENKYKFILVPIFSISLAITIWQGVDTVWGWAKYPANWIGWDIQKSKGWSKLENTFPGIGKEFMPTLQEGSFLLMPTSMPHAGIEQNKQVLQQMDMLLSSIPEVTLAVGKLGRVESALDPAPISMYETIINYHSEYLLDKKGKRKRFQINDKGDYYTKKENIFFNYDQYQLVDERGRAIQDNTTELRYIKEDFRSNLIGDEDGQFFRVWRPQIQSTNDIWKEIEKVTKIPGVTSAPKLQPIETRLVMLQTGMRAPMGIKVYGPDLRTIQSVAESFESLLKSSKGVAPSSVFADEMIGKPYLRLEIDREKISRFGLNIKNVQEVISTAIGGEVVTQTVEGRERYEVLLRYPRGYRERPEALKEILVPTTNGSQIPLTDLVNIKYQKGPQMIKSESTFLVGYVLFDKQDGFAEVDVVQNAQEKIKEAIENGKLSIPKGVHYKFSGTYENQVRAEKKLAWVVPLVLFTIFVILYLQFKSVSTSLMVFAGVAMAFSGGFILLWFYSQDWFLNIPFGDLSLRDVFQIREVNLSVAVWVGFIALFGIATDDGVLMATYLNQSFSKRKPEGIEGIRKATIAAGKRRVRPAVMTTVTTIIALLPILTSTGKGSNIMIPMAIPAFGGMLMAVITYFIVPVLYAWKEEISNKRESI